MKNKIFIILFLGLSFLINAQDRTPSSTITPSPVNTCVIPSCYPFQNLDLYQIFGAIKSNTSTSTGTVTGSFYDNNSDTLNNRLKRYFEVNSEFSKTNSVFKTPDGESVFYGSEDGVNFIDEIVVNTFYANIKADTTNKILRNGIKIINPISSVTIANSPSVTVLNPVSTVTAINLPANQLLIALTPSGSGTTIAISGVPGKYHYITNIEITLYYTGIMIGNSTPTKVKTINLYDNIFVFKTAGQMGGSEQQIFEYATNNLKSQNIGFDTTFQLPAVTNGIWKITVNYYVAP